jgi:hypothetical protein
MPNGRRARRGRGHRTSPGICQLGTKLQWPRRLLLPAALGDGSGEHCDRYALVCVSDGRDDDRLRRRAFFRLAGRDGFAGLEATG